MLFEKFNEIFEQVRKGLSDSGMSNKEINEIKNKLHQKIQDIEPPKIAIIGFTGVGKSSTLNALFNAGQQTSDVRACTQEAKSFTGNLKKYTGSKGIVNIYDMPGLGESIISNKHHYGVYAEILPHADVIVWTFHAGDRAMAPMQDAILTLIDTIGPEFTNRLMFAINKADAIAPGECEWNNKFNIPSANQKQNLRDFEQYIKERVHEVLPKWHGPIVSYSAKRRYHLEQLMTSMVHVMPKERQWVLNNLADVADFSELVAPEYLPYIQSMLKEDDK